MIKSVLKLEDLFHSCYCNFTDTWSNERSASMEPLKPRRKLKKINRNESILNLERLHLSFTYFILIYVNIKTVDYNNLFFFCSFL